MTIAIIDYGAGNLFSVAKALLHVAEDITEVKIVQDAEALDKATHIILPGVGTFAACMAGLTAIPGMLKSLEDNVLQRGKPFLGICVGMQLMMERGFEHGEHAGLGWIEGDVVPLTPDDASLSIPHMGWNELRLKVRPHPLFKKIDNGEHAYFVHSFYCKCTNPNDVIAEVDYGGPVTAAIQRDNMFGVQFHPEKSQKTGLKLLRNFLMV